MTEVDQSVVDEILAKAAEDTEEGRLEKLEREVETLKGSIKRLLLDIRETMNKLENPFVNLQSLAESNIIPPSSAQIQVVPAKVPDADAECKAEEEKAEEKKEEKEEKFEAKKNGFQTVTPVQSIEKEEAEIKIAKIPETEAEPEKAVTRKIDLITLFRLLEWAQSIVSRHSYDTFKLMLDIFGFAGYINDETRDLILKLAELARLDGREMFIDLYRLHRILKPGDRSLDSDLLALLLEKR